MMQLLAEEKKNAKLIKKPKPMDKKFTTVKKRVVRKEISGSLAGRDSAPEHSSKSREGTPGHQISKRSSNKKDDVVRKTRRSVDVSKKTTDEIKPLSRGSKE